MTSDTTYKSEMKKCEKVAIRVQDDKKNMKRTYKCEVGILLKEMKYFEKHLQDIDSTDEIDIAV